MCCGLTWIVGVNRTAIMLREAATLCCGWCYRIEDTSISLVRPGKDSHITRTPLSHTLFIDRNIFQLFIICQLNVIYAYYNTHNKATVLK